MGLRVLFLRSLFFFSFESDKQEVRHLRGIQTADFYLLWMGQVHLTCGFACKRWLCRCCMLALSTPSPNSFCCHHLGGNFTCTFIAQGESSCHSWEALEPRVCCWVGNMLGQMITQYRLEIITHALHPRSATQGISLALHPSNCTFNLSLNEKPGRSWLLI